MELIFLWGVFLTIAPFSTELEATDQDHSNIGESSSLHNHSVPFVPPNSTERTYGDLNYYAAREKAKYQFLKNATDSEISVNSTTARYKRSLGDRTATKRNFRFNPVLQG